MPLKMEDILNVLNAQNGLDKQAADKEAMPPATTVMKQPVNQPTGDQHELEAALGAGAEDRRAILRDQLMETAGTDKADESREDPDEGHNVSIETKADELMPPTGNAGAEYQGPVTPESKISADCAALALDFWEYSKMAAAEGDDDTAEKLAQKAMDYKDMAERHKDKKDKGKMPMDYKDKKAGDILASLISGVDSDVQKEAEEALTENLLKMANEYYHAGRIFGTGFLDEIREQSDESEKVADEPDPEVGGSDKFAQLEQKVDTIAEFLAPLAEALNNQAA